MVDFMEKLRSLTTTLQVWKGKVKNKNLSVFEHLRETLDKSKNIEKTIFGTAYGIISNVSAEVSEME